MTRASIKFLSVAFIAALPMLASAQLTGNVNIAFHPFYFQRTIEEVTSAGTYDDMQTGMCEHSACHAYLPIRWRGAAFGYSCA